MKYSGTAEINKFRGKISILSIPQKLPVEPNPFINEIYSSPKIFLLKNGKIGSLKKMKFLKKIGNIETKKPNNEKLAILITWEYL